jgi:hypothetical protein
MIEHFYTRTQTRVAITGKKFDVKKCISMLIVISLVIVRGCIISDLTPCPLSLEERGRFAY